MGNVKKGASPPTWKLILVKWLGLFPILLGLTYTLNWLGIKPTAMKLFIESIILVPLLAYVITPFIDSLFSEWLYKGIDEDAQRQSVNIGS